jgi:hypothetical protein
MFGRGLLTGKIYDPVGLCPQTGCGSAGGLVTVFDESGHAVAHEFSPRGRSFAFVLLPGRYALSLGRRLRARTSCAPPSEAVVSRGQTTRVDVHADCGVI